MTLLLNPHTRVESVDSLVLSKRRRAVSASHRLREYGFRASYAASRLLYTLPCAQEPSFGYTFPVESPPILGASRQIRRDVDGHGFVSHMLCSGLHALISPVYHVVPIDCNAAADSGVTTTQGMTIGTTLRQVHVFCSILQRCSPKNLFRIDHSVYFTVIELIAILNTARHFLLSTCRVVIIVCGGGVITIIGASTAVHSDRQAALSP